MTMRHLLLPFFAIIALQAAAPAQGAPQPTSADKRIAELRQQLATDPKRTEAYADLALAAIRRARDTGDGASLAEAEKAVATGQKLAPGDFQLAKAHVALLLARQQWKQALAEARVLNTRTPDDVTVYGYVAEADLALGDEADAEKSAQWMLNMRPNNVPGLLLGAELRVRFHDAPGALDFLSTAYAETPQIDPEEQAWIADRMAEVELNTGQVATAEKTLARAEELFPHSPTTAALRARLLAAQEQSPAAPAVKRPEDQTPALAAVHASPAPAQPSTPVVLQQDKGGVPTTLLLPRATNTDRTIKKMQGLIAATPSDPGAYAQLGAAFFQRARETGDVEDYNLAEQALSKALSLQSDDLPAAEPLATMAEVCMGEHRFADALTYAQRALALGSGDVSPFAIVGDAYADMGEYEKAAIAYARLQPSGASQANYAQETRTAYLTFVGGDTAAAISQMQAAISHALRLRLPAENLAWLYYELGEFSSQAGQVQTAADAYYTALTIYPGNYRALAGLGKVRAAQGKLAEATTLYQSAIAVVPMPLYIAELGDIYAKNGQPAEAEKQYKLVEYIGRLGHINQVLHNRDLALFYADHDRNLPEALTLARKEFEVRSDIYTWDALAWALYKNGKYADANEAMHHALRLDTKDAVLLFHAGMISAKLGQQADATRRLDEAMALNPHFSVLYAAQAAEELATLRREALVAASTNPLKQAAATR